MPDGAATLEEEGAGPITLRETVTDSVGKEERNCRRDEHQPKYRPNALVQHTGERCDRNEGHPLETQESDRHEAVRQVEQELKQVGNGAELHAIEPSDTEVEHTQGHEGANDGDNEPHHGGTRNAHREVPEIDGDERRDREWHEHRHRDTRHRLDARGVVGNHLGAAKCRKESVVERRDEGEEQVDRNGDEGCAPTPAQHAECRDDQHHERQRRQQHRAGAVDAREIELQATFR